MFDLMSDVPRILSAIEQGDPSAAEQLLPLVYDRITLAHRELSRDNLGRAREHLEKCPPEQRQWEWRYLKRHCRFEPLVLRHKAEVNSLAFSPAVKWIAVAVMGSSLPGVEAAPKLTAFSHSSGLPRGQPNDASHFLISTYFSDPGHRGLTTW
jgi:hypothetical protein